MNTVKLTLFAATLLLACPVFAQDDPSLAQLQAQTLSAQQREKADASAQLHYLKSLNAHAMQVFVRAVQSLIKSGVKLKTSSQMEKEMEEAPGTRMFEYASTRYSPYIAEEYTVAGDLRSDEGPEFELVGEGYESVSMTLPIDPNVRDLSDMDQSELSKLVSPNGHPLDSCQITISIVGPDGDKNDTPALSCPQFLQGNYDTVIIDLVKKVTRQAIIDGKS